MADTTRSGTIPSPVPLEGYEIGQSGGRAHSIGVGYLIGHSKEGFPILREEFPGVTALVGTIDSPERARRPASPGVPQ